MLHPHDNLRWCDFQNACELYNRPDRRAVDTALNQADVRSVKASSQTEAFLRDFPVLADLAKRLPERLLRSDLGLDLLAGLFTNRCLRTNQCLRTDVNAK
jgi:hypothetical protein